MNIQSVSNHAQSTAVIQNPGGRQGAGETVARSTNTANTAPITQQPATATKEVESSREDLDKAVKAVNDFVSSLNNSLQFTVDGDTGKSIVKVIDSSTKEVIKQFPSEEMLAIAKALDGIKGLLVHQKV